MKCIVDTSEIKRLGDVDRWKDFYTKGMNIARSIWKATAVKECSQVKDSRDIIQWLNIPFIESCTLYRAIVENKIIKVKVMNKIKIKNFTEARLGFKNSQF